MTLDAIPGKEWHGAVDYVYPILDPATRTLRVRLKFTNRLSAQTKHVRQHCSGT
ncbi:membrane fusion protein CzcB family [Vibrio variabilis]|uniref:Membrane fusion protein CzcB family n=1 Tax=Vibrio variabilis TaxID=990271 RepID=A0ABQ0JCJ6_9VIBR|nr:membrane fusion protein CzcB family [Vibrio variabilis]